MRLPGIALAVAATAFSSPRPAAAQVVVPPRGEGTVTLAVESYRHTGHFDKDGNKTYNTSTETQTVIGHLDFGVTDTIGLAVSLPFISSKYTGPPTYIAAGIVTHAGPLDNGQYHSAFQDLHFEVRRMFVAGPVVIAPLIGVGVPTHEYEFEGESAPGRHRKELQLGVGASTDIVPRTEINARYAYTTLERVDGFPYTASIIDLHGDVSVTSRIGIQGLTELQIAHQRPTTLELVPIWPMHDRFINPNQLALGGGVSWSLTRTTDVHVFGLTTVWGNNGAHIARTVAVGFSKTFGDSLGGFGR
jgi:hypothetical protein